MNATYVTLLSSENYLLPVLALNQNLKDLKSNYPLLVIVPNTINSNILSILSRFGILYKIVDPISYHSTIINKYQNTEFKSILNTATKIQIFNIDYNKAVYLDADSFFVKNIDNLMDCPDGAMYSEPGFSGGFSGLFTFIPQNHNFEQYKILLNNQPILDGDLLADLWFPYKTNMNYRISIEYFLNITLDNLDSFITSAKGFHFCYKYKPWHYKTVKDFNEDFYAKMHKPYSQVRSAIVDMYLNKYILDFSKKI